MTDNDQLPRLHSAASAAKAIGVDPKVIRAQLDPIAYSYTTTGREHPLFDPAAVQALAAWTAVNGPGGRWRSFRRSR
jgi:hypothetical protein